MKKISLILFIITTLIFSIGAQNSRMDSERLCDFGVTFEISSNPSWGYGEPVILAIQPYSPADKAGLKVGDVIMEVNGIATYLRNYQTISNWFSDTSSRNIRLTVRNVDTYFQDYNLDRDCKSVYSVSESELAASRSFYSIENTNQRAFTLPLKVDPNLNVDFTDYHTFDFIDEGNNVPNVDFYINSQLEKALTARGLKRTSQDPDIIVQSYYTYQPNVKHDPSSKSKNIKTWRYDTDSQQMIQLPILSGEDPNAETKGLYVLELGVRFFDKKYIDQNKMTQIWDCRTREFLTEQLKMEEYVKVHMPLMLMQFPYSAPKTISKYIVSFKAFNYTGLYFDSRDLKTISYLDTSSPAQLAGIHAGDVVQKIDKMKFDYSLEEQENGYRRFIVESMPLRDKRTRFVDANGFPDCMYWNRSNYADVEAMFRKQDLYTPCFSYLYSFEKYIPTTSPNTISIQLKNPNGETRKVSLTPKLQRSITLRAL